MPAPKTALSSPGTPTTPKLVSGNEKDALERSIRERIAERAYSLFEASGRVDGKDVEHWAQAESEILLGGLEVRESGSWLAITGALLEIAADSVQIYLEPRRVVVRAVRGDVRDPESRTPELKEQEVFLVEDLKTEVEPTTASASLRDQQLTLMVKKRHPANVAARGASAS